MLTLPDFMRSVTRKQVFSKMNCMQISMPSGRENDEKFAKIQNFNCLDFFDHFESFQDATSVFYFWIFREFGVPDHEIWQNP